MIVTQQSLLDAQKTISPHIHRTPMLFSRTLSEMAGCSVHLKAELFQKTGSYKPRGMLLALMRLSEEQLARGVITFSAGNAAQGLAYAAGVVGARSIVVMPAAASPVKVQATRDYGAEVILHGTTAECQAHCLEMVDQHCLTFISSYDNDDLITGHSSMALEILETVPAVDSLFVGIGGGGMAGGVARVVAASGRDVRLFGVEPSGAAGMRKSLDVGHPISLEHVASVADGLAAPGAGRIGFELVREYFADVIVVEDTQIIDAMKLLMSRCKIFAEPAGAASLAGMLASVDQLEPESDVVCVISGGNIDFERLKDML